MAQELDHLIRSYEQHGLRRAARALRHLRQALVVGGALPPTLTAGPAGRENDATRPASETSSRGQGAPASSVRYAEQLHRLEEQPDGSVSLRPTPEELQLDQQQRELEELVYDPRLHIRPYGTLERAGFKSLADVEFAIDHHLLRRIPGVGPVLAAKIEAAVRHHRSRSMDGGTER